MLQVFKRNNISAYIALLFVVIICKLKYLLHPELIHAEAGAFTAFFFNVNRLKTIFTNHPGFYVFWSILIQFVFAIWMNGVINRQKLYSSKNYFPALSFILITSFLPSANLFSAGFIANVFLFMAFSSVLQLSNPTLPRKTCFNIGLWVGIATFFYFPLILFLVVFLLFVWLLRPFVLQELVACLFGFMTPFYFALMLFYLNGNLMHSLGMLNFHLEWPAKLVQPVPFIIFGIIFVFFLAYSLIVSNTNAFKNTSQIRKKWRFISIYLFFAMITVCFSFVFPHTYLIIALTPFSILLSHAFHNRKEKRNIFTFFFLIISLLCVQWIFLK